VPAKKILWTRIALAITAAAGCLLALAVAEKAGEVEALHRIGARRAAEARDVAAALDTARAAYGRERARAAELERRLLAAAADAEASARRAERQEQLAADLEAERAALEAERARLRAALAETRRELREKEQLLALLESPGVDPLTPAPPAAEVPAIDAVVTATKVDLEPAIVLLSAGADDGVEAGHHFSVYRGDRFIAKVVVERVLRDSAGCRVLFTADGQQVRPGDQAATVLN